ncbi:glycine cleavage system protein H [Endozoicomonas sp. OPT23]|uniref:glycine cleavage system protein GcvH n=1 Tax=Endozoicomonas sp. OPT23 TaxID=2072845 RepID=UPI00129B83BF|nr:glycine cleavage system protein GcvH [Endozoicomonas sp. OPT23]MRI31730.1 glycine cleavage system protein H [Endozoicomonas sp. OPT23]
MSSIPSELRYVRSHEWIRIEDDGTAVIGITEHAQESLGDVVFVELPEVGAILAADDEAGVVESVKAASDIYAPLSGEVVAVNETLEDAPETVNGSSYQDGWFFKLKLSDEGQLTELMDAEAYAEFVDSES